MHTGKCPNPDCQKVIPYVVLQGVDIKLEFGGTVWKGVSMQCPSCRTVLSTGIDPIAVKTDLVAELVKLLRGR